MTIKGLSGEGNVNAALRSFLVNWRDYSAHEWRQFFRGGLVVVEHDNVGHYVSQKVADIITLLRAHLAAATERAERAEVELRARSAPAPVASKESE